jgi:hypothetical protein
MTRRSPEKHQLLQKLLQSKGIEPMRPAAIGRRGGDGDAPLSYGQQRLWFLQQLDPGSSEYNDALTVRCRGAVIDAALLERCIAEVVRRHAILRTRFESVAGVPVQRIAPELAVALRRVDLRGRAPAEQESALAELWLGCVREPFVLDRPPLFRAVLARLGEDDFEFGLTMHHIVSDGVAYTIFFRELTALYEAFREGRPSPLAELPIQFADYATWERETVTEALIRQKLPFWKRYLGGEVAPLALPADRQAPTPRRHRGAFLRLRFPGPVFAALQDYCRRERVTSNWVLLAAYLALLHRYTGQTDVAIGTPSSVRGRTELEPLIGFFVQTLILRVDLGGNPTFQQVIRKAQEAALEISRYEDVPFDRIFQAVRPGKSAAEAPLIQAWIAPMKNLLEPLRFRGATSDYRIVDPQNARFDVSLILDETPEQITGYWEYDTDLFAASTVERWNAQLMALLAHVLRHPDTTLQLLVRTLREADRDASGPPPAPPKKELGAVRRKPRPL